MRTVGKLAPIAFTEYYQKEGKTERPHGSRDDVLAESENLGNYAVSHDFRWLNRSPRMHKLLTGPLMAGHIPDREEKIKNAICFFAFEHERLAHRPLTHTSLYKYLAFLDYASIEETGRPALGLLYLSRVRHPLPIGTFARLAKLKKDRFVFLRRGGGGYLVKARGEPDVSYFSPLELKGDEETRRDSRAQVREGV